MAKIKQKLFGRRFIAMFAFLSVVAVLVVYLATYRLTALMALRWFVRQTDLPFEVHSANWSASLRSLREGRIHSLTVAAKHVTQPIWFSISTPVDFKRKDNTWSLTLAPKLRINNWPELQGSLHGDITDATHFHATFSLKTTDPVKLEQEGRKLSIEKLSAFGTANVGDINEGEITSHVTLLASGISAEASASEALQIAELEVVGKNLRLTNGGHVEGVVTVNAKDTQMLQGSHYAEFPALAAHTAFEGARSENGLDSIALRNFTLTKPHDLRGHLTWKANSGADGEFKLAASSQALIADAQRWFGTENALLQGAQARGSLKAHFKLQRSKLASGRAELKAADVRLPGINASVDALNASLPLEGIGSIDAKNAAYGPVNIPQAQLTVESKPDAIKVTSPAEKMEAFLFQQKLHLSKLLLTLKRDADGIQLSGGTLAIKSPRMSLGAVQKAFCFQERRPIPGHIEIDYPNIEVAPDVITARGELRGEVFQGRLHLKNIELLSKEATRLKLDLVLDDIDLKDISEWLEFGKVTGRMDVSVRDAEVVLLEHGALPLRYNFSIRGSSAPKRQLNFSAKALDNLMDLMGVKDATSGNPLASVAFSVWRFFGNTFGFLNNIDYFGFHAKTIGGYTSLATFDPPGSKEHYLINGTSFKMPLKSTTGESVIYPVIMRTDTFQSWLRARINWFQSRAKEKSNEQASDCTPIW